MKEFIAANGGLIATVALVVLVLNTLLSGIKKALYMIMDKTATTADNKLYDFINSACQFLGKILDVIGHNPEHSELEEVKTEEKK